VPANGFNHSRAHDALADVEATIHIAKLIRSRARPIWDQQLALGIKRTASEFVRGTDVFIRTDVFGRNVITRPVTLCGLDPSYDAQVATFHLTVDPTAYLSHDEDELLEDIRSSPEVIRPLRLNSMPVVLPTGLVGRDAFLGIEIDVIETRVRKIRSKPGFQQRVGAALSRLYEDRTASVHPEEQIYDGFPSRDDEALMLEFHRQSDWSGRAEVTRRFGDQRLKHFAYRLIYAEAPDALTAKHRQRIEDWIRNRVLGANPDFPWTTIGKVEADLEKTLAKGDQSNPAVLEDIRSSLNETRLRWQSMP
jgi:exodeoxyribonuclease-1